ncbi:MAG: AEC family transporter [Eubacterium sp.]|nr:AEC family transporter [Eubacterium sp.]
MENFIFSLNATIPVFLVILLGYILKRLHLINEEFVNVTNKYVFKVALPVMLFKDLAFTDITSNINGRFISFCISITFIMFLLTWFLTYQILKDKSMVGAFTQASVRSSAAILGVAFVENICGNAGMAPLMIASAVPFFNVLSVIILVFSADMGTYSDSPDNSSLNKHEETSDKREYVWKEIRKAVNGVLTNPIIIGIVAGLLFVNLRIKMPAILIKTISYISATATPMALIAIGGGFDLKVALTRLKPAVAASVIKLIALPALFIPVAVKLGFSGSELVAILIMLASPTTVTCYIMAKAMQNDEVLTSNVVVITTLLSSVTLTLWVFILKSCALI